MSETKRNLSENFFLLAVIFDYKMSVKYINPFSLISKKKSSKIHTGSITS